MWPIIAIVLVTVAIAAIEVPGLRRKKRTKELWVFTILLLLGAGLTIADSLQMPLPNPLNWITYVYRPLGELIYKPLQ